MWLPTGEAVENATKLIKDGQRTWVNGTNRYAKFYKLDYFCKMIWEIHIYLGTAAITEKSNYNYPIGERHPFLLYLKANRESEYNHVDAEQVVSRSGLDGIQFSKVGKLDPAMVNNEEKREYYDNAMKNGSTLILYTKPV